MLKYIKRVLSYSGNDNNNHTDIKNTRKRIANETICNTQYCKYENYCCILCFV